MKRKLTSILIAFFGIISVNSQTVQWAVRPTSAQLEGYGQLIKVRKNGKVGLIDHNSREVIPARFDSISPFRDGFALALNRSGKQLRIEAVISDGDFELQPLSETVYATRYMWFSDGKMPVKGSDGWGYLGTDGNMAIPCQFQAAFPFSEGFASVLMDDKAYYIDRNMDYLPVEAGYGNLVFASTFSGNEAVVYSGNSYTPKGYVINRRGRIVRSYKVKSTELKINKYDHSVGDKSQQYKEQVEQLEIDSRYSVYQENRLYGYKRNGEIVLPAQLEKAEPVRGNYANVRFRGQNGVLRMVEGKFSVQLSNNQISVSGKQVSKGSLNLNIPTALEDASIQVRMIDAQGNEMAIQAYNNQGTNRSFSFQPVEIPHARTSSSCRLEVWNDNLLLWEKDCLVNYSIKGQTQKNVEEKNIIKEEISPKLRIASLSLSKPRAKGKRANPKNDFFVTVTVSNSGDERGNATISLYVDGKPVGNKNVSVRGQGTADAIFPVSDVRKERYAKVKAVLKNGKNGKNSDEANIHFMPFN